MNPEQFIFWLKGFVAASHHHNLTPKAWDELKDNLDKVKIDYSDEIEDERDEDILD